MFGLNKKKNDVPPDVGEEDKSGEQEESGEEKEDKGVPEMPVTTKNPLPRSGVAVQGIANSEVNIKIEQLNAKVDTMTNWMKQVYERFSYISESIGEIRSMNVANEKKVTKAIVESNKASGLLKEVQPGVIRLDYRKSEAKIEVINEKLESHKLFIDSVVDQFNDLKRRADVFIGTDEVIKLNDDTKKELIEIQKLAARSRLDADKSEQVFMELKKSLSDSQKMSAEFAVFNSNAAQIKKEIEGIKIDHSKVIGEKEFASLKGIINRKFKLMDVYFGSVEDMKETNSRMVELVEKILRVSKANKENMEGLVDEVKKESQKRVEDYEGQLEAVLRLVDTLAGQISELKKQVGEKPKKIMVMPAENSVVKNNVNLQHMNVPNQMVKQLIPKQVPVSHKMVSPQIKKPGVVQKVAEASKKVIQKPIERKYPEDKEMKNLKEKIARLSKELGF